MGFATSKALWPYKKTKWRNSLLQNTTAWNLRGASLISHFPLINVILIFFFVPVTKNVFLKNNKTKDNSNTKTAILFVHFCSFLQHLNCTLSVISTANLCTVCPGNLISSGGLLARPNYSLIPFESDNIKQTRTAKPKRFFHANRSDVFQSFEQWQRRTQSFHDDRLSSKLKCDESFHWDDQKWALVQSSVRVRLDQSVPFPQKEVGPRTRITSAVANQLKCSNPCKYQIPNSVPHLQSWRKGEKWWKIRWGTSRGYIFIWIHSKYSFGAKLHPRWMHKEFVLTSIRNFPLDVGRQSTSL